MKTCDYEKLVLGKLPGLLPSCDLHDSAASLFFLDTFGRSFPLFWFFLSLLCLYTWLSLVSFLTQSFDGDGVDVRNMTAYLVEHFGYKREDMVILTDDQQNPMSQPSKQNILRAMHWLVKDARPNDALFFHYSGESDSVCPVYMLTLAGYRRGTGSMVSPSERMEARDSREEIFRTIACITLWNVRRARCYHVFRAMHSTA